MLAQTHSYEIERLKELLAKTKQERDLLKAVISITCADCSVKDEQISYLFSNLQSASSDVKCASESRRSKRSDSDHSEHVVIAKKASSAVDKYTDSCCVIHSFSTLSRDLLFLVCEYMDHRSLSAMACVCKNWNTVANEEAIWQVAFLRRWPRRAHALLSPLGLSRVDANAGGEGIATPLPPPLTKRVSRCLGEAAGEGVPDTRTQTESSLISACEYKTCPTRSPVSYSAPLEVCLRIENGPHQFLVLTRRQKRCGGNDTVSVSGWSTPGRVGRPTS